MRSTLNTQSDSLFAIRITVVLAAVLTLLIGMTRNLWVDPLLDNRTREDQFWVDKTFTSERYDLVMLGDSRLYRGVSPDTVSAQLDNRAVLNFGYSSGGLNSELYAIAERSLASSAEPPIILLAVTPHALTPNAARNDHLHELLATRWDQRLILQSTPTSLLSFFEPISIQTLLSTVINVPRPVSYFQEYMPNGWVASNKLPRDDTFALASYGSIFNDNQVDPQLIANLHAQVARWQQQGIVVFAFRPPTTHEMVALEDRSSGFDEAAFVTEFEAAGGRWLMVEPAGYASYDGSHLDASAARQLSTDLAALMQHQLQSENAPSGP